MDACLERYTGYPRISLDLFKKRASAREERQTNFRCNESGATTFKAKRSRKLPNCRLNVRSRTPISAFILFPLFFSFLPYPFFPRDFAHPSSTLFFHSFHLFFLPFFLHMSFFFLLFNYSRQLSRVKAETPERNFFTNEEETRSSRVLAAISMQLFLSLTLSLSLPLSHTRSFPLHSSLPLSRTLPRLFIRNERHRGNFSSYSSSSLFFFFCYLIN